jgi:hypothetical protein
MSCSHIHIKSFVGLEKCVSNYVRQEVVELSLLEILAQNILNLVFVC